MTMTLDVAAQIRTFNAGRDPRRLKLKHAAMRASPFAFLRGTCHLFYARMARGGVHKAAPKVWVCGDLHLENFGSYKGDNRLAYFDINDFDESALAPATWDLVRFLASVQVGAAALKVGDRKAQRLCETFVEAYADALALGKAYWVERDTATGLVHELLEGLGQRDRASFIAKRTRLKGNKHVLRVDGVKALAADPGQRKRVAAFMREFAKTQATPSFYELLDVACRIAGTGSLGVERYVILVRGKGSPDRNYLLDLKVSAASSLTPRLKVTQPRFASQAARIVAAQRRLQAVPMDFLHAVEFDGKPAVLRGLQPSEDRVELDRAGGDMKALGPLLATMGQVLAWAQLRSAGQGGSASVDALIDFGRRQQWRAPLLAASRECAAQVFADAKAYNAAFDAGFFALAKPGN
ncbi:MAG: DUF2252 family protein [Burkholderiales bacterium]